MENSKLIRLTGMWSGTTKAGGTYLTGNFSSSSKLLILPNTYKKQESDPDYIAYIAPKERTEEKKEETPRRTL